MIGLFEEGLSDGVTEEKLFEGVLALIPLPSRRTFCCPDYRPEAVMGTTRRHETGVL